jgi:hypothetical protein
MNLSRYNIEEDNVPQGLRRQLAPLFSESGTDAKPTLNLARELLERILHHLSTIAGVELREVSAIIEKLASAGVIDHDIRPYFHFWWGLSCLGSHYQPFSSRVITWEHHLNICRQCIEACIAWYLGKYPPLNLTDTERVAWLKDMSFLYAVPYDDIQLCRGDVIEGSLDHNNVVFLTGRSWVGKTSIGCRLVTELTRHGYVPLVIHENSLVTFRALPNLDKANTPKNLRLAANAQLLHEIVVTRLLHGESFVVFLDDPFGHRHFQPHNPLMYLRISDWLRVSAQSHALGSLKVIITSPLVFVGEARAVLADNARTNPIAAANEFLLDARNVVTLDVTAYAPTQVAKIVRSAARYHSCSWTTDDARCDLVADALISGGCGFDALHVLCRDLKLATDDDFLNRVIEVTSSADIVDAVRASSQPARQQLCAALIGESLIEFYREFCFQTSLHFRDVLSAVSGCATVEPPSDDTPDTPSEWLLSDRVSTLNLLDFPVFSHPEVRHAASVLAESDCREMLRTGIYNLCGLSESYNGVVLSRWEATHLLCRMASVVNDADAEHINNHYFATRIAGGGDPRNVLWAILGNWAYIANTPLHRPAYGFLKVVPHNLRYLNRTLIWEATENWTQLDSTIRTLVLEQTAQKSDSGEWKPLFNDHTTLAFLAAGVAHYGTLQESARAECEASDRYLEFMNVFITQLKKAGSQSFTSRKGDGLHESPGNRYGADSVCQQLLDLGLRSGSLTVSHPLAQTLARRDAQQSVSLVREARGGPRAGEP